LGHVLNYQHRRYIGIVVSNANHAEGFFGPGDRVTGSPVGYGGLSVGGSAGVPSSLFEPEQKGHSVLLPFSDRDRTTALSVARG
jgi:hypothetical protein